MRTSGIKKLYYSISEVSKITDIEQYVLRYWETEFEQLRPAKNRAGNRIYTNNDIKVILHIKKLLREDRYTIEGAKHVLLGWKSNTEPIEENLQLFDEEIPIDDSKKMKEGLREIKYFLEDLLLKLN